MGASSTKEEKERKDRTPGQVVGSADESDGASTDTGVVPDTRPSTQPIDIPKQPTPPVATAWVGSTNSPVDDYGTPIPGEDPLLHAIPPLNDVDRLDSGDATLRDEDGTSDGKLRTCTFRWTGEAESVAVAGSFNNWTKIPLKHVGHHEYMVELELPPVNHQYKYIVDGRWRHDPLAPVVASGLGSLNNLMNIANGGGGGGGGDSANESSPTFEDFDTVDPAISFGRSTPPGEYSQNIPVFDESEAPPLLLPPHLKEATLNSEPLRNDPSELPVPNHVILDHLYAQSVKDSVLVLGATQRYRRKYITTVMHKPI
eukprot:m.181983 g.181983  ORF g.181983 m.181983 type:complete len:314 (+) comp15402_c0_seq1:136-1077(+)